MVPIKMDNYEKKNSTDVWEGLVQIQLQIRVNLLHTEAEEGVERLFGGSKHIKSKNSIFTLRI